MSGDSLLFVLVMKKLHQILEKSGVLANNAPGIFLVEHLLVQFDQSEILDCIRIYYVAVNVFRQIALFGVDSELGNAYFVEASNANNKLPNLLIAIHLNHMSLIFALQLNFNLHIFLWIVILNVLHLDMFIVKFAYESLYKSNLVQSHLIVVLLGYLARL